VVCRLCSLLAFLTFAPVSACATFEGSGTGGNGGTEGCESVEKKRTIRLVCTTNFDGEPGQQEVFWELAVDPTGRISGGDEFGASFSGVAELPEVFLDDMQTERFLPNGLKTIEFTQLQATVHVREGATGRDVVLTAGPTTVQVPFSDDCTPSGICDTLSGRLPFKNVQCTLNGFCVTGPLPVPLEVAGSVEGYRADSSGHVRFGWDDQNMFDETGAWIPSDAVFEEEVGPNGFRAYFEGAPVAFECTMAERGQVQSPPSSLISFPICP